MKNLWELSNVLFTGTKLPKMIDHLTVNLFKKKKRILIAAKMFMKMFLVKFNYFQIQVACLLTA